MSYGPVAREAAASSAPAGGASQGMGEGTRTGLAILLAAVAAALAVWVLPQLLELFTLINATIYVSMAVLALSLALVWGFGGILCFGQAAFFGLGGYAYAVAAINLTDSTPALPLAILVPTLAARDPRLFHVLRPHQRRLHGRHHADADPHPLQVLQLHRRRPVDHRRGRAGRLQRHALHAPAQHAGRPLDPARPRADLCRRRGGARHLLRDRPPRPRAAASAASSWR